MTQPITGYRQLSDEEIELINDIKLHGGQLADLIKVLRNNPDLDQRWVAIGQTNLQHGIMDLVRAVAQPEGF